LKNITPLSKKRLRNYASRIPELVSWNEGTWVPQMTLTGDGTLLCTSALGFQSTPKRRSIISHLGVEDHVANNKYINYGIRITAKKKIMWNIFSMFSEVDNDDNNTHLCLELCGLGLDGNSFSSIRMDSSLERFIESSRVTIFHERIVSNNHS